MAPKNALRCTPSFEALASLARTLCEEQNKEAAPSRTSAPKSKPVKKDPPPRRVTGKGPGDASSAAGKLQRGKSKVISMEELIAAGEFDPSNLPFQLTWKNFNKLKAHLQLTEQETTSILLAMVGPSPEGKAFWQKYKVENKKSPEETAVEPKAEVEDSSKKRAVVGGETASKADPPQQKRLRRMEHVEVDDAPPGDVTIDLGYSSGTEFGDDSLDGEEEDDDDAMALLWVMMTLFHPLAPAMILRHRRQPRRPFMSLVRMLLLLWSSQPSRWSQPRSRLMRLASWLRISCKRASKLFRPLPRLCIGLIQQHFHFNTLPNQKMNRFQASFEILNVNITRVEYEAEKKTVVLGSSHSCHRLMLLGYFIEGLFSWFPSTKFLWKLNHVGLNR